MRQAFETNLGIICYSTGLEASQAAINNAVDVCGVVADVGMVEVGSREVHFWGKVPRGFATSRLYGVKCENASIVQVQVELPATMHTTWDNLVKSVHRIGYLTFSMVDGVSRVLSRCVLCSDVSDDYVLLKMTFDRILFSLDCGCYGICYCRVCGGKVPDGRVKAIPGVVTCVDCQTRMEGM